MTAQQALAELAAIEERTRQLRSAADHLEALGTRLLDDCRSLQERVKRVERDMDQSSKDR